MQTVTHPRLHACTDRHRAGSDMDPEIHDALHGRPGTKRHTTAKEETLHAGNVEKPRALSSCSLQQNSRATSACTLRCRGSRAVPRATRMIIDTANGFHLLDLDDVPGIAQPSKSWKTSRDQHAEVPGVCRKRKVAGAGKRSQIPRVGCQAAGRAPTENAADRRVSSRCELPLAVSGPKGPWQLTLLMSSTKDIRHHAMGGVGERERMGSRMRVKVADVEFRGAGPTG